ncbi:MAG TPA: hypothetical protein PKC28_05060 [Bdellovibrionales bacterium]|nr:hypothetical protein [Bdellovibrionales bacterium]
MKSWVNPKWRAGLFLALANAAWMWAAWQWTDREEWLWLTPIALSINFLLLTYDQILSFSRLESHRLEGQDPWGLLKIVHRLSEKFAVREPRVFLLSQPSAQIFSYARSGYATRLYVTEGALKLLTAGELEAALTFQMVAARRAQTILNYWVGAVLDLLYRLGRGIERAFAFVFGWTPALAAAFIRPFMWAMQWTLMSRRDFEKLDRETARLLTSPEDLARALWKMDAYAQTMPWRDPWVFAHMCIVSPLQKNHVFDRITLQPSLSSRIRRLTGRYPL